MKYTVIQAHRSEYPEPIRLRAGEAIIIGEKYEGPEDWDEWIFCSTAAHPGGWVPGQIIGRNAGDSGAGVALEDYDANELNVDSGDEVYGSRILNGWVWCEREARAAQGEAGWVPLANVKSV